MQFYQHSTIKNWMVEDRPREKMIQRGVEAVSEAELIGVLLGTGHQNASAVDLGRKLIQAFGGIIQLSRAAVEDLVKIRGIGHAKATQLVAAFELARRKSIIEHTPKIFSNSSVVADYLNYKIGNLPHEVFYVLFLDQHNQLLGEKMLFVGGTTGSTIDVNLLFKKAMLQEARRIIVAHNHPSGVAQPSGSDEQITRKIVHIGDFLGIQLMDHLILTGNKWYSFLEAGRLIPMRSVKPFAFST